MTEEKIGVSLRVFLDSISMRLKDGLMGKGGVDAISQFIAQSDWIDGLDSLQMRMENCSTAYEQGLAMCNKELMKRPEKIRQKQAHETLGYECPRCGLVFPALAVSDLNLECPSCHVELIALYLRVQLKLLELHVKPTPEAVMMFVGFDKLADAYVAAYEAVGLVFSETARLFRWERFRINDPEFRNYLDMYFFGRLAGEQKIPPQEKRVLQFVFRGNLAGVGKEDAEKLIRLGIAVVKWGNLFQQLQVSGADVLCTENRTEFSRLYNTVNGQIRLAMLELYGEARAGKVHVNPLQGGYYSPCLIMPRGSWESGSLSASVEMEWVSRLPIFSTHEAGSLQMVFSAMGSGKTFLLSSLASYAVTQKHEIVFSPLNDKSNSFALAGVPLFGHEKSKRMQKLEAFLKTDMGIEITGLPCITLNILREKEKPKDLEQFPPTKFDRIIRVEDPKSFTVDFKEIMAELKEAAEPFGYSRPVGVVNVRNFDRYDSDTNTHVDIQAVSVLLDYFDRYRKGHLTEGCRIVLDEISYAAPSQIGGVYGSDASRSAATISDFIKESRRARLSIDSASLARDEQVVIVDKGRFKLTKIGDFVDKLLPPSVDVMAGNWSFLVPAFNQQTLQVGFLPLKAVSRHKTSNSMCRVKLAFGKSVQVTDNHSLFGMDQMGDIHPIAVKYLKKGDFVACPQRLHFEKELEEFNLVKFLMNNYDDSALSKIFLRPCEFRHHLINSFGLRKQEKLCELRLDQRHRLSLLTLKKAFPPSAYDTDRLQKWSVKVGTCGSNTPVKAVIPLDNDVFWLLGLIAADGCLVSNHIVEICVGLHERHMLDRAQRIFNEKFGVPSHIYPEYRGQKSIRVQVGSSGIYLALSALGLKPSDSKHNRSRLLNIPNIVFSASLEKAKSFVQGFWDGDGTKYNFRPKIDIATSRLSIANDLTYLLLKFGLQAFIVKSSGKGSFSPNPFYRVIVEGATVESLKTTCWKYDAIPCPELPYSILKTLRAKGIIKSLGKVGLREQDSRLLVFHSEAASWKWGHCVPTRRSLRAFLDYFESQDYSATIKDELDKIRLLVNSDITWHKVTAIENMPYNDYVYDLEVDNQHQNFIGGIGGVFCHNTQMPLEVMNELRNAATNIFFRDLAKSRDKSRSQIDFLLETLRLEDPSLRTVIRDMNEKALLPRHFWFWWNNQSRSVSVIRPCPPVFMPLDVRLTPRKLFSLYEKRFNTEVLLDGWDKVKVLGGEREAVVAEVPVKKWD